MYPSLRALLYILEPSIVVIPRRVFDIIWKCVNIFSQLKSLHYPWLGLSICSVGFLFSVVLFIKIPFVCFEYTISCSTLSSFWFDNLFDLWTIAMHFQSSDSLWGFRDSSLLSYLHNNFKTLFIDRLCEDDFMYDWIQVFTD